MKLLVARFMSQLKTAQVYKVLAGGALFFIIFFLGIYLYGNSAVPREDLLKIKSQYPVLSYHKSADSDFNKVVFVPERPSYWVSVKTLPSQVWGAIVVSEDWAFFEHNGADFLQIWRALRAYLFESSKLRGASTITQQVAKNVFLNQERSFRRKIKEYFVGQDLEALLTKDQILEIYLNIVEWGEGIVGIKKASWHYFEKEPSELTPSESAYLAFLLPSPLRYSKGFRSRELSSYGRKRIVHILKGMLQARYIDEGIFREQVSAKLAFEANDSIHLVDEDLSADDYDFDDRDSYEDDDEIKEASPEIVHEQPPSDSQEQYEEQYKDELSGEEPITDEGAGEEPITDELSGEEPPTDVNSEDQLQADE